MRYSALTHPVLDRSNRHSIALSECWFFDQPWLLLASLFVTMRFGLQSTYPCALSLVVDSQRRVVTISEFAQLLSQPVTTVKRLFANEVLNAELVDKTNGGHWRIRFSPDDLRQCSANIAIWQVLRRKPRIARSYNVRDPVQSFGAELLLLEHEINSGKKSGRTLGARVKSRSPRLTQRMLKSKLKVYKRALIRLKKRRSKREAIWWYKQMLKSPQVVAGTFVLRVAIQRFRAKHDRPPKQRELAEALNISERSLYRWPFGRGPLRCAYRGRCLDRVEAEDGATDDRNESHIFESDEELSPEKRRSQTRERLGPGFHEVRVRRPVGENTRRKLRRSKTRSVELAWEDDSTGRGKILAMYPTGRIEAKGRLELIDAEASCNGSDTRRNIKRNSRKIRRDLDLEERDSTFGGWTAAVYEVEADGKYHWWTNFDRSEGCVDSAAQVRREILSAVARCRTRFPIVNLTEMLAEAAP